MEHSPTSKKNKLTEHFVLLTGGSSGIGKTIADSLIMRGATVGIISRREPRKWENGPPNNWDSKRNWLKLDLSDANAIKHLIYKWLGRINHKLNVVIHCAVSYGYGSRHSLLKTSLNEWDEIFTTNVRAQFIITKETLPVLEKQPKSLILSITSDVAFKPGPERIIYASSKAASHSLFSSLSEELKDSKVTVVEVLPTKTVNTPGIRKRRPATFDFSSYYSPQIFVKPVISIVKSFGAGLKGNSLLIDEKGINIVSSVLKIAPHG